MLRTNLSTRPFYNERAVHVLIGLAAFVVLAITVLNGIRIVSLSRHNTELSSRIGAEQAEAERLTAEAGEDPANDQQGRARSRRRRRRGSQHADRSAHVFVDRSSSTRSSRRCPPT